MSVTFDLHIHTSRYSPDSNINPFSLVHKARELGLDGIVITEHDWLWPEAELDELRAAVPEVMVFGGVEVSAKEGHFLVIGATDLEAMPNGVGVVELCRQAHRQGAAIVAAHPFRWGQRFDVIVRDLRPELDGLELMSANMDEDCRTRAAQVKEQTGWAGLGCSDAHQEDRVGHCFTIFDHAVRDQRDLVEAIRSGAAVPRERIGARV